MLRVECARSDDHASLYLDASARRALACVLADWLNVYAGIGPGVLRRQHLDLVLEVRRLLLVPDEQAKRGCAREPPR